MYTSHYLHGVKMAVYKICFDLRCNKQIFDIKNAQRRVAINQAVQHMIYEGLDENLSKLGKDIQIQIANTKITEVK